jgi:hypothetical protein
MRSDLPLNRDICFRCICEFGVTSCMRLCRERRSRILFDFIWDFHQLVECQALSTGKRCGTYLFDHVEVSGQPVQWGVPYTCRYRLEQIMAMDEPVSS